MAAASLLVGGGAQDLQSPAVPLQLISWDGEVRSEAMEATGMAKIPLQERVAIGRLGEGIAALWWGGWQDWGRACFCRGPDPAPGFFVRGHRSALLREGPHPAGEQVADQVLSDLLVLGVQLIHAVLEAAGHALTQEISGRDT